jgi:hypothetical protein
MREEPGNGSFVGFQDDFIEGPHRRGCFMQYKQSSKSLKQTGETHHLLTPVEPVFVDLHQVLAQDLPLRQGDL